VFAYGAAKDRELDIPGEASLKGIYSARQFVGWYNGLPDSADLAPDLSQGDEAIIIGQGNVALDVARMLLEDVDVLRKTDIAESALDQLSKSQVRRVRIVGRRGPMQVGFRKFSSKNGTTSQQFSQAAFTIKEVRELMKLSNVAFHPADESLMPSDRAKLPRAPKRLMDVISKGSAASMPSARKSWSLDFCLNPTKFLENGDQSGRVGSTEFERTMLASLFDPAARARATGDKTEINSGIVFRSIGYKSVPLSGFSEAGILFDEKRGVLKSDGLGRVLQQDGGHAGQHFPRLYCSGWVKRGPTGVIASTMEDAFTTADSIAQDWLSGSPFSGTRALGSKLGWQGVRDELAKSTCQTVTWSDWHKIDKAEKERGRKSGKEREKFTSTAEMLAVLD
jgi:adrenodoxin-NADP+ reductase